MLMDLPKNGSNSSKNDKYLSIKKAIVYIIYSLYICTLFCFCSITAELIYMFKQNIMHVNYTDCKPVC